MTYDNTLDPNIQEMISEMMLWNKPVKISCAIDVKPKIGIFMYGYLGTWPHEELHSYRTPYQVGDEFFDQGDEAKNILINAGMLVYETILDDNDLGYIGESRWFNDHRIVIPWGKHRVQYIFRGTEDDAVLRCLQYGGRVVQ